MPAPSSQSQNRATLRGIVERVTFHTEETGSCVLKVRPEQGGETVTVLGKAPRVVAGERIEATGEWVHNAEYGRQFKADAIRLSRPESLDGLTRYLGSGLIDGIGPEVCQAHRRQVRRGGLRHHRAHLRAARGGRGHRQEAPAGNPRVVDEAEVGA